MAITTASDIQSEAMHDMLVQVSGNSEKCAEDAMLLQKCLAQDSAENGSCQACFESLCACLSDVCTPHKTDHQQDMQ